MKLEVGDMAPDFRYESVNMGEISLTDYRGERLLLVFGRYFGCPVCQLDFEELLEVSRGRELSIVYFTQSLEGSSRKYIESRDVGFPVVPVPKENGYQVYKDYGVGMMGFNTTLGVLRRAFEARKKGITHGDYEGRESQSPGDFVVDEEGRVIWVNRGLFESHKLQEFLDS